MHNAYLTSPTTRDGTTATWPAGGTVYKEDFAWFAKGVFESINGDQGGNWVPAAAVTIGGAGLVCTTVQSQFYGVTVNGAGTLVCNANAFLNQDVTLGDTHGDTTTVNGVFIAQWHATFNDAATFNSTVTCGGTATFNAFLHATSDVSIDGGSSGTHKDFVVGQYVNTEIAGPINFSGETIAQAGKRTLGSNASDQYRHLYQADAPFTLTGPLYDSISFATSAARLLTIPAAGGTIASGFRLYVDNFGASAGKLHIIDTLSNDYGYLAADKWVLLELTGGGWAALAGGSYVLDATP